MADPRVRVQQGPLILRAESGKLLSPIEFASRIENMVETEEGSLRTLQGPSPYLPAYTNGASAATAPASGSSADASTPTYGPMHGVFHARVGTRDILLVHTGNQIWSFQGWARGWSVLLGPSASSPLLVADIPDDSRPGFPTQFEATGTGVLIIPQNARAYFYDGTVVLPFGYAEAPGAPSGLGPKTTTRSSGTANDGGYAHDANGINAWTGSDGPSEMLIGTGRLGTIGGAEGGTWEVLEKGEYRAAQQWIDRWGNLSPVSGRSDSVVFDRQLRTDFFFPVTGSDYGDRADTLLKQVLWSGLEKGPEGTVGRILFRTKDLLHSGTNALFEVPPNATEAAGAFATIPDNLTTVYPDNVPDGWLLRQAENIAPVPKFKLARMAFGRMWIANTDASPSLVRWSLPGRWGTFREDDALIPDTSGAPVTGMWRVAGGLLLFTEVSTFLVLPSDDGQGFKVATVHPQIGCVAPSSIATLSDGLTVWLGREGFYAFDGEKVFPSPISSPLARELRSFNKARRMQACAAVDVRHKEYRCWTPIEASATNNVCWVFTPQAGWRRRTDVQAAAVCVTQDHRHYMLAVGVHRETNGVWLLDHGGNFATNHQAVLETAWIESASSENRKSPKTVKLWLREDQSGELQIEVMRDWRETVVETFTGVTLYPTDDTPPFWGDAAYGTDVTWRRRRPFWRRCDISLPSCEVFKLRISLADTGASLSWDFLGLTVDSNPKPSGGSRTAP